MHRRSDVSGPGHAGVGKKVSRRGTGSARSALAGILAVGVAWLAASPAGAAVRAGPAAGAICSSASDPGLAAEMSGQITAALRGRQSAVGLAVSDPATGLACELDASRQFDSASVVKATILAALLHRDAQPDEAERLEATQMITESDNDAASDLWGDVGPTAMEQFLGLADMTQTVPGPGGYWGLTQVTARDQMRLLHLLITPNGVLDNAARSYELGLMSEVEAAQRWGVSAGVPAGSTIELKNGWLPRATLGWRINSIGCVSGNRPKYCLVVLTDDNPTMAYGVQTVSAVSEIVNRDLHSPLALGLAGSARASISAPTSGGTPRPAQLTGTAQARALPTGAPGKGGPGPASTAPAGTAPVSSPARGLLLSAPGSLLAGHSWLGIALICAAVALIGAAAGLTRRRRP